jgi:hypothetical protein
MLTAINFATFPLLLKIVFSVLVLWYAVLWAGTMQFRRLKQKTVNMVLERAEQMAGAGRERLPERVYEAIYPEWCDMVRKSAWFIPSKSELRPIPATAENVKMRFGFSPKWVRDCLRDKRPELLTN